MNSKFGVTIRVLVILALALGSLPAIALQNTDQREANPPSLTVISPDQKSGGTTQGIPGLAPRVSTVDESKAGTTAGPSPTGIDKAFSKSVGPGRLKSQPLSSPQSNPGSSLLETQGSSSPVPSIVFDALGQNQSCFQLCVPPDVEMAAGPNQLMEMVNTAVGIFLKNGTTVMIIPSYRFFNVPSSHQVFDPKALFDNSSQRWFASMGDLTSGLTMVAVSKTNNPAGNWTIYQLPQTGGVLTDQPILGVSGDKVVVTANVFGAFLSFTGAIFWVMNKNEMLNTFASIDIVTVGPDPYFYSIHPSQSFGVSNAEYMISNVANVFNVLTDRIATFSLTGVPPGPISSNNVTIPIGYLPFPSAANQPGAPSLETGDSRFQDAVWYQGKLWGAGNTGCTPTGDTVTRSCIRLVEIDTTNSNKLQDFNFGISGQDNYYPGIRTDKFGNLIMLYGYSSQTNSTCCYPSLAVTEQPLIDPPQTLVSPHVIRVGTSPNNSPVGGRNRYGDYFAASVDPSDPTSVWVAGEYHNSATGSCKNFDGTNTGSCWSTTFARVAAVGILASSAPSYVNLAAGGTRSTTITIASLSGFANTLSMSASTSSTALSASVTPSSATLSAGGSVTATLSIMAATSAAPALYNVTMTSTAGSSSASLSILVRVGADFSIGSSAISNAIQSGSSAQSTLALSSSNSFSGTVTLSPSASPPGISATASPSSPSLSANGTVSSILTITTSASSPSDTYKITVIATSGSISHSTVISIKVVEDFVISANPAKLQFPTPRTFNATSNVKLVSTDSFSGSITLSATSTPPGIASSISPSTTNLVVNGTASAIITLSEGSSTPPGVHTITINATGTAAGTTISRFVSVLVSVPVPDFTFPGSPQMLILAAGSANSNTNQFSIISVYNFAGSVNLTASISPVGPTVTLSTNSISLSANQTKTFSATVSVTSSVPSAFYTLTVVGTSGSLSHSTTVQIDVQDYALVSNPSSLVIATGSSAQSYIAINGGVGGFQGVVNLTTTVSAPGLSVSIASSLSSNVGRTPLTLTMAASTPTNSYTVTVSGVAKVNGQILSRSTTVSVTLPPPDIQVSVNPSTIAVNPNQQGSSTIQLTSMNNFQGTVTLSASSSPTGVTTTFNPATVSLSSGSTASSVASMSSSATNTYTVSITVTSGSVSHSVSVTLQVGIGLVCLQDPTTGASLGQSPCPAFPATFNGPVTQPATQLDVGVYITGSNGFTSFDVVLKTDHTVLMPAGVSFSGSILTSVTGQGTCVAGLGNDCSGAGIDSIDTIHAALFSFSSTSTPTSGLLFTAIFNIVGTGSGISVRFQIGCSGTSVPNGVCVTTRNSSNLVNAESIQEGSFNNGSYPTAISWAILSSQPTSVGPVTPSSQTFVITATGKNGFPAQFFGTGVINFAFQATANFQGYLSSLTCDTSAGGTVTNGACSVNLVMQASTPAGNYIVTVYGTYSTYDNSTGTFDTLVSPVTVNIIVFDFSFTASPTTTAFTAGGSATSALTMTSLNSFSGTLALTTSVSPTTGLTAALNQTSITLAAGSTKFATATFTSTTGGIYTVTIRATVGTYTKTVSVRVFVKDFKITASPTSATINAGQSTSSQITVTSLGTFSGTVGLTVSASNAVTATLGQNSLLLKSNGSNSTTLTVTSSFAGRYNVTVTGSNGGLSHSVTITVIVQDFSLSSSSPNVWVARSSNGNVSLSLQSMQGFTGNVTFSVSGLPSGASSSLVPTRVLVSANGQASSFLVVSANSSVAFGNYPITLTASSGGPSHSISLTLRVLASVLTIPSSGQPFTFTGVNATISGTLTLNTASARTLTGTLTLASSNQTTGANIYSVKLNVTLPFGDFDNGLVGVVLDIPASPLWLSVGCVFDTTTLSYPSSNCFLSRTPDVFHTGNIDINAVGFVQVRFNSTPSSSNWDPRADLNADNIVDISDVSTEQFYFGANVFLPLATASPSPGSVTFAAGSSGFASILFQSYAGFSGTLALTSVSAPTGLSCTLNPTSVSIGPANATSSLSCSIGTAHAGNYTVTVTGTKGTLKTSAYVTFRLTDFTLTGTAIPNISHGSSGQTTLTITSLNGFSGTIAFTGTISPTVSKGPTATFSPVSLQLVANGSGTSTLTVSTVSGTPKGSYTLTITATSGPTVHTITLTFNVT